jgi:hypothetical protein
MRKLVFGIDIITGIALLLFVAFPHFGCTAEQVDSTNATLQSVGSTATVVAPAVITAATTLAAAGTTLGWPAWVLLVLNVVSSTAAAIVAAFKGQTTVSSNQES